jgi:hypothetical protein
MSYPQFPTGGNLDRPLWYSTFDPRYMQGALNVFCDPQAVGAFGGGAIYNTNAADPPSLWNPRYAMTSNAGNHNYTSPILWAQILGPKRAILVTYAGGQQPD